jgi:hypothetical protein
MLGYKVVLLSIPKDNVPCAAVMTEDISTVVKADVEDAAATLYFFNAY